MEGQSWAIIGLPIAHCPSNSLSLALPLVCDREEQAAPVEFTDEDGKVKQLKLDDKEFREVIGILKEAGEEGEGA